MKTLRDQLPGVVLAAALACWSAPLAAGAGEAIEVLNLDAPWRFHLAYRPPVYGTCEQAAPKPAQPTAFRWVRWGEELSAPLPEESWREADFDDFGWPRGGGPFLGGYGWGRYVGTALLCVRGRFAVDDPARAAGLKLALTYRGGAAVYLNGRQVARGHLSAGPLTPLTPAADYAREAFLTPDGEGLLRDYGRGRIPPEELPRFESRLRRLSADLPAGLLRKGTNVLAVEVHRTAIPAGLPQPDRPINWDTAGLCELKLMAGGEAAKHVRPNVRPPAGPHLWNASPMLQVGASAGAGDALEPLRPIELDAPVNGFASGQVVLSSPRPIEGLSAKPGELKSEGGATIPAASLRVRYARLGERYVPLLADPPADANTIPIWLTVKVPPTARPGRYTGELALSGPCGPARVGVELTVHGWRLGEPKDWKTVVNLLQSPESVAGHYKVPLWSDRHFALMERSMGLLAEAGNDVLGISAVTKNVFGDDPLIVFRRTGPGAADFAPDLTLARRYLELYDRIAGKPRLLSVHVWSYGMYQRGTGRDGGKVETHAKTITIAELRDGHVVETVVPIFGEPGTEAMWRPAMDGLREIVKRLGWPEDCLLLGTSGDCWVGPPTVAFFKKVAPYARWRAITHGNGVPLWGRSDSERTQPNGMVVGYCELARRISNLRFRQSHVPITCNSRDCCGSDPFHHRALATVTVGAGNFDGICWKGLDYWPYATPDGKTRSALNTYVQFGNMVGSTPRTLAAPGPEGAVATVQFEMLKEGIQDCEAMILIREALGEPQLRARLGADLADRCAKTVDDLLSLLETGARYNPQGGGDVRRHVRLLYAAAGEVAGAIERMGR